MLKWRQMILWANILLLLRGSPLASVSTQLCSVPRIQRETKDEKNWETAERVRKEKTNKQKVCHIWSLKCEKIKDFKESGILSMWIDGAAIGMMGKRKYTIHPYVLGFSNSKRSKSVKLKVVYRTPLTPPIPTSLKPSLFLIWYLWNISGLKISSI